MWRRLLYYPKLKSTQHIEVKIDLDEMDLTKAESKAKVPQVPLEKENAIEDALRHFQMI